MSNCEFGRLIRVTSFLGQPLASQHSDRSMTEEQHAPSAGSESNDNFDNELTQLTDQAERCRRLAGATYNREVSEMLGSMAEGYERSAEELSRKRSN
jgi:hypothetical protein